MEVKYEKGTAYYHPDGIIKSWRFDDKDECRLAETLFAIAEQNGVTINHFQHIFPAILRMLGQKSRWAQI